MLDSPLQTQLAFLPQGLRSGCRKFVLSQRPPGASAEAADVITQSKISIV